MAAIDRYRVSQLIELHAAERTVKGPERLVRENDVQQLIKAAWDDANEKARADFQARVEGNMSAWPWSAVQAISVRGGGGGGGLIALPKPVMQTTPPLLGLILGQVELPDVDPGNRIPDRNTAAGVSWAGLYKALDSWDVETIKRWWSPTGWVPPTQGTQGPSKGEGFDPAGKGGESPGPTGGAPAPGAMPAPQAAAPGWTTRRIVIVGGAAVGVTVLVVYSAMTLSRARELRRLSETLRSPEGP